MLVPLNEVRDNVNIQILDILDRDGPVRLRLYHSHCWWVHHLVHRQSVCSVRVHGRVPEEGFFVVGVVTASYGTTVKVSGSVMEKRDYVHLLHYHHRHVP